MQTELIIILAAGPHGKLEVVGHYEMELDDQPGLERVMSRAKQYPDRRFYALSIDPDRAATLHEVMAAPRFGPLVDVVLSHPTGEAAAKHQPPGHAMRHARHKANQRLTGQDGHRPCWGCDNDSSNPEQHVCDFGNREE